MLVAKLLKSIAKHEVTKRLAMMRIADLTNRINAYESGEKKYQGQPCINGHSGTRYTKSGCCIECVNRNKNNDFPRRPYNNGLPRKSPVGR